MPSAEPALAQGVDLRKSLALFFRRKWTVSFCFLLSLSAAVVYNSFATPLYQAKASVFIEYENRMLVPDAATGAAYSQDIIRAQKTLALSRPVMDKAESRTAAKFHGQEEEIRKVDDKSASIEGQLLVLKVVSPDKERAAQLANEWVQAFVDVVKDRQKSISIYKSGFLAEGNPELKQRWITALEALNKFQHENRFDPEELKKSPIRDRYMDYNQKLVEARERFSDLKREAKAWEESRANLDLLFQQKRALKDLKIQDYDHQIQEQRKRLLEVRNTYNPNSREVLKAENILKGLEEDSRKNLGAIEAQVRLELRDAEEKVRELDASFKVAQTEFVDFSSKSSEFQRLTREAELARIGYESLAIQKQNADVASRVNYSYAQPWELAEVPKKVHWPILAITLSLGFLAGILLACLVVYLLEVLDDTAHSSEQVQAHLGLDVWGILPLADGRWQKASAYQLAKDRPRTGAVESLRALRTSLAVAFGRRNTSPGKGTLLLVTSAQEGEGKSFVAGNLSYLFAQNEKKVLLIDFDVHKHSTTSGLGFHDSPGLLDLARAQRPLAEFVRPVPHLGLWVLCAGKNTEGSESLIDSEAIGVALKEARSQFDLVILDAPPVLAVSDACRAAGLCDLALLVIRSRHTRLPQVQRAAELLRRANAPETALVLNGINAADAVSSGYGYGYGYAYSKYAYGKERAQPKRPALDKEDKLGKELIPIPGENR